MHYEVELRQPDTGDGGTGATWRPARLVRPRTFATLDAARVHAERLRPKEARVVAVEPDGRRRMGGDDDAGPGPGRAEDGPSAGRCTGGHARRNREGTAQHERGRRAVVT